MLDVRRKVAGRWVAAVAVLTIAMSPAAAGAHPGAPAQAEPDTDERTAREQRLVNVDVLVATNAPAVATTLGDLSVDVANQLAAYTAAQDAVAVANQALGRRGRRAHRDAVPHRGDDGGQRRGGHRRVHHAPGRQRPRGAVGREPHRGDDRADLLDMDADESAAALTSLQALAQYEEQRAA